MRWFSSSSLQWRILCTLLLCVLIGGAAAAVGLFALDRTRSDMDAAAARVSTLIEAQNDRSERLASDRQWARAIDLAENPDQLHAIVGELKDDQTSEAILRQLIDRKQAQFATRAKLEALREELDRALAGMTGAIGEAGDQATRRADASVDASRQAIVAGLGAGETAISTGLAHLARSTDQAVSTTVPPLALRLHCYRIKALIGEILLASEPTSTDTTIIEIHKVLAAAGQLIASLPHDQAKTARAALGQTRTIAGELAKTRMLLLAAQDFDGEDEAQLHQKLATQTAAAHTALAAADKAAEQLAQTLRAHSAVAIRESMDQARNASAQNAAALAKDLKVLSDATDRAARTTALALALRATTHRLASLLKDALLVTAEPDIAPRHARITETLKTVETALAQLAAPIETQAAVKTLGELLDRTVGAKRDALAADCALAGAVSAGHESAGQQDSRSLAQAAQSKGEVEQTLAAGTETLEQHRIVQLWAAVGGLMVTVALGVFVSRSIARPLRRVVGHLTCNANGTARGAALLARSSEALAHGASLQAEGSAAANGSIGEMTSLVATSAQSAEQARDLSAQAGTQVGVGTEAMGRMAAAIDEMKASSDETAKIVKTIDEIAFQTNLLALNASVEAARAGEAGKGFAVVADEVRNLAQRSAQAAQNIGQMIQASVDNADNGVTIAREVSAVLARLAEGNQQVNDLVSEMAHASATQSQGIAEISHAVSNVDRVTRDSAGSNEESAAAAEHVSARARQLIAIVAEVRQLVDGGKAPKVAGDAFTPDQYSVAGASSAARRRPTGARTGASVKNRPR